MHARASCTADGLTSTDDRSSRAVAMRYIDHHARECRELAAARGAGMAEWECIVGVVYI